LDPSIFPSATVTEFYRLALLLAGDVYSAQQLLATCLADLDANLDQFRTQDRRRCWMVRRMRQQCLAQGASAEALPAVPRLLREDRPSEVPPEVLGIEAYILAQRFHHLPEPERSALALLYLNLFDVPTIATVLGMSMEELAQVLERARMRLQESLRQVEPISLAS
jgi:DNA-directed RNA polymerase specialized sigma24 family protein